MNMKKEILLVTTALVAAGLFAAVNLEWNGTEDASVPYEMEIAPARLGWQNLSVRADGKALPFQAFDGREKGFVGLRFAVPKGTKRLTCEKADGALARVDSSAIDNLFAGALDAANVGKWTNVGGEVKKTAADGVLRAECTGGHPILAYEAPVPAALRGQPAKIELDIESKTRLTWGGSVRFLQLDADGKPLPQSVSDPRWTSHMRPKDVKATYREDGRFDPRVARVRVEIELRLVPREVDEYGMPNADRANVMPVVEISRLALRGAAAHPFPRYDDANFAAGVSGEPDDAALVVGGERAFWYQCNPRAVWAEATAVRDEEELFFPVAAGTAEAWFKPTAWDEPGKTYALFDAYNGYHARLRKQGYGSMFKLVHSPASKALTLKIRDVNGKTFRGSGKAELPVGVWTHVAMQWTPGRKAEVFVNGAKAFEASLEGYAAPDLSDTKDVSVNDRLPMEFYVGSCYGSARQNPKKSSSWPFFNGAIDACRVSSGLRYADGFTPAKRFAVDAATRALFGFDRSFDGVSGGGTAFVRGTFRSLVDRVSHTVTVDGKTVQYRPKDILPEADPRQVLDIVNYPTMPTADEFESAREVKQATFALESGETKRLDVATQPYMDFVEIRNVSSGKLTYPVVFNEGDLDPRSFGDLRDTLLRTKMSDRDRVNLIFNFVIKASDYFMDRQISFMPGEDRFGLALNDAMLMLNSYCGFECGPLNNMTANMFACSGGCLASETGGYGHAFEEVFYDGKNHIYDLSAQSFFTAMDNESAAYLEESGDQPGIHNRLSGSADHFIRFGYRGFGVQNPGYCAKVGVVLSPGESFRVWFGNDGWQNMLRTMPASNGGPVVSKAENLPWKTVYTEQCHADLKPGTAPDAAEHVWRVLRKFPDFASGYVTLDVKPEPSNPAFTDVAADSFVYPVKSGYQIVRGDYEAVLADGRKAPLELSTDRGKTWRPLPEHAVYEVMARLEYLVRVKAPIASVARFRARTQLEVNARIFPGRLHAGANALNFKAAAGGRAEVTVQWREKAKRAVVKGGAYAGTLPGWERQLFVLDPAKGLELETEGFGPKAAVVCSEGLKGAFRGGKLVFSAPGWKKDGFASATVRDGKAEKVLTFYVSSRARLAFAEKALLGGTSALRPASADSVQPCVWMTRQGDSAKVSFEALPAGKYMVFALSRFPSRTEHANERSHRILGFKVPGSDEFAKAAGPVSIATGYYKAEYGPAGGRGNFKWDTPVDQRQKYNVSDLMARYDLPAFSELDWSLCADRAEGVEFAAALVVPAGDEEEYLALLSYLAGLNFEEWRVR